MTLDLVKLRGCATRPCLNPATELLIGVTTREDRTLKFYTSDGMCFLVGVCD